MLFHFLTNGMDVIKIYIQFRAAKGFNLDKSATLSAFADSYLPRSAVFIILSHSVLISQVQCNHKTVERRGKYIV